MPTLSGHFAAVEIKKLAPDVPIIAQTDYAIFNEEEMAIKAGCDDYISKPISWTILSEKMAIQLQKANQ